MSDDTDRERVATTGDMSVELLQLESTEASLASSLKALINKDGGSMSASEIFQQMGDVYKRRGLLTNYTQHFVTASALYNAALLRTKSSSYRGKLEALLKENEIAFCEVLSLPVNKLPIHYKVEVKEKLENIRSRISLRAVELLQNFGRDLNLKAPEYERKELEKVFVEETRSIFKDVCTGMISLDQYLITKGQEILGPPPQEYVAIAMGSLSRGEATPYSDLEWAILVEDDTADLEYFRNLVRLVHLFVLNIGETYLRTMSIKSLNDCDTEGGNWFVDDVVARGFEFDSALPFACKTPLGRPDKPGRPGIELIRTPQNLAKICQYETAKNDRYIFDRVLTTTVKLWCSANADDLFKEFTLLRAEHKAEEKIKMKTLTEIHELLNDIFPELSFHTGTGKVHDIKREMFRLPSVVISLFKTLYGLDSNNTWDILGEMNSRGILTEEGACNLQVMISIVTLLRLVMYCSKSQQNELLSLLPTGITTEETGSSDKVSRYRGYKHIIVRYYYSIYPFVDFLRELSPVDVLVVKRIDSIFFDTNDFYEGCIDFCCFQLQNARDKLFAHIETTWRSKPSPATKHPEDILIPYKGRTILCDHTNSEVARCLTLIGKTYMLEEQYTEALKYFTHSLSIGKWRCNTGDDVSSEIIDSLISEQTSKSLSIGIAGVADVTKAEFESENLMSVAKRKADIGKANTRLGKPKLGLICFKESLDVVKNERGDEHSDVAYILNLIGSAYQELGNYVSALKYHEDSLRMVKKLHGDKDHRDIAACLNYCGSAYLGMSKHQLALQYYLDCLNMRKRIYCNSDHPDIVLCLINVGNVYDSLTQQKIALSYYQSSLDMHKRIFGDEDHPGIATCLNSKGVACHNMGNYVEALRYYREALELRQRVHGKEDHPEIASCLNNLGSVYNVTCKYQLAFEFYEQAFCMRERIYFDKDHPKMASSLNNIGFLCNKVGKIDVALKYHLRLLGMRKRIHGDVDHYEIASCMTNIGNVYYEMGELKSALQYYQTSLAMQKRLYGDANHLDISSSLNNIGNVYGDMEEYDLALKHLEGSLSMTKAIYGNVDHQDVASGLHNIGSLYVQAERPGKALRYFQDALGLWRKIHGYQDHHDIALCLSNIGSVYDDLKENELALQYYQESLNMMKKIHRNINHPDIASCLNNIGNVYDNMTRHELALEYYQESVSMKKKIHGHRSHPDKAASLNNIAILYSKLGKYEVALLHHQEALSTWERFYENRKHPQIASTLHDIGKVYSKLGKTELALQYYQDSLSVWKKVCGDADHPALGTIMSDIGDVYNEMGKLDLALQFKTDSLKIIKDVYSSHPFVASAYCDLGWLCKNMGLYQKALMHNSEYLKLMKVFFRDKDDLGVANAMNNIGEVYLKIGEIDEAFSYCSKSLNMIERIVGEKDHPSKAETLGNLGLLHCKRGKDFDLGLHMADDSLEMNKRLNSGDHECTALSLTNLGLCYQEKGNGDMALTHCEEALSMRRRLDKGRDHPYTADTLRTIGALYLSENNLDVALRHYTEAFEMKTRMGCITDNDENATMLLQLSDAYKQKGDTVLSEKYKLDWQKMLGRLSMQTFHRN